MADGGQRRYGDKETGGFVRSTFSQPPASSPVSIRPISHSFQRRGAGSRAPVSSVSCSAPGASWRQSFPYSGCEAQDPVTWGLGFRDSLLSAARRCRRSPRAPAGAALGLSRSIRRGPCGAGRRRARPHLFPVRTSRPAPENRSPSRRSAPHPEEAQWLRDNAAPLFLLQEGRPA